MGSSLSGDESRLNGTQNVPSRLATTNPNFNTGELQQVGGSNDPTDLSSNQLLPPTGFENDQLFSGSVISSSLAEGSSSMNASNTTTPFLNHHHQNNDDEFSINLFGYMLYPFRWITLTTLTSWLGPLSSLAMIIGCVMPYIPQYITIYKTKCCSGFSTFVCLTLLLANILRIAFWFGHPFELPLLIQSIIMILAQILLLELCIRAKRQYHSASYGIPIVKRTFFSSNPRWFWRWTDLASYLEFLFIITTLLSLAVYFFLDCKPFIETLGYCALFTESMLGLPQVIKNHRNRSVQGMSLSMVLMWLAGDTFKTGYFVANAVPYQFWLCGSLQITIDLLILFQVCLYRQRAPVKKEATEVFGRGRSDSPKEMMAL